MVGMQNKVHDFINDNQHLSSVNSDRILNLSCAYSSADFCLEDCEECYPKNLVLEKEWRDSLPKFDGRYLRENFAGMEDYVYEGFAIANKMEKDWSNIIYCNAKKEDEGFWWLMINKTLNKLCRPELQQYVIKPIKAKKGVGVSDEEIARAKQYPIDDIMDFKHNVACCIWHDDTNASLHYYPKTNTLFCFGACGKARDAIDAYMQVNSCDFISAVKSMQ